MAEHQVVSFKEQSQQALTRLRVAVNIELCGGFAAAEGCDFGRRAA